MPSDGLAPKRVKHSAADLLKHLDDEGLQSYKAFVKELQQDTATREGFIANITAINSNLIELKHLKPLAFSSPPAPSVVLTALMHHFAVHLAFRPRSTTFNLLSSLVLVEDQVAADSQISMAFGRLLRTPADHTASALIELIKAEAADSLKKERTHWERQLKRAKPPDPRTTDFDLAALRQVPIQDLLPPSPSTRQTQSRLQALCPFHQERTPSFVIFTADNHFHCYGCQAHGDVITFIQKLHSLNFKRACEFLSAYV